MMLALTRVVSHAQTESPLPRREALETRDDLLPVGDCRGSQKPQEANVAAALAQRGKAAAHLGPPGIELPRVWIAYCSRGHGGGFQLGLQGSRLPLVFFSSFYLSSETNVPLQSQSSQPDALSLQFSTFYPEFSAFRFSSVVGYLSAIHDPSDCCLSLG